jgi:AcrR family transcriptional regulator
LSQHGPDAIGLKDVAAEAGVSHALVTHYFGTYDALVEAALEERSRALRDTLVRNMSSAGEGGIREGLSILFEALRDPLYGRLAAWAILSGRSRRADFFARKERGLARVADVLEARLPKKRRPPRDEIELLLVLVLTSSIGWAMGREALLAALERDPNDEGADAWFEEGLAALVGRALERP